MQAQMIIGDKEYRLCFEWEFVITVLKVKSEKLATVTHVATGGDPDFTVWALRLALEKKEWMLREIKSAKATKIILAYNIYDVADALPEEMYGSVTLPSFYICDSCNATWAQLPGLRCMKCTQNNIY